MTTDVPPGIGSAGKMGLYVHNTCVEFKRDILRAGAIAPGYVAQLDGCLKQLVKAGTRVQNSVLTVPIKSGTNPPIGVSKQRRVFSLERFKQR